MNPTSNNKITGFNLFSPEQLNKDRNNFTVNAAYFGSIELIQRAGICCKLPMKTINTAIMIFLRYFANNNIIDNNSGHSINDICRCALFSAAKIEETHCRLRDIMNATFKITSPNTKLPNPNVIDWHKWKDRLIELESIILNEINFEFNAVHPHQFVLHQCNELKTSISIAKLSWSICNDCLYSRQIMLSHKPHEISAAAIYVAAQFLSDTPHFKNNDDDDIECVINNDSSPNNHGYDGTKEANWWRRFDIDDFVINTICMLIMDIYESPFARFECEDDKKKKNKQKNKKKRRNNNNKGMNDVSEEEEDEGDAGNEDEDDDLMLKTPSPQKKKEESVKSGGCGKEEMSDDDEEDNDIEM